MTHEAWPQPVLDLLATGGDRVVYEDGPETVTAAGLSELIQRIATGLRATGVEPGHGVALRIGVSPLAFAGVIAAFAIGARVSGIRPGLTDAQLAALRSRSDAVLVDEKRLQALALYPPVPLTAQGRPGDVARIMYTSGSTGDPKGCFQTYESMSAGWPFDPGRWSKPAAALATGMRRYLVFGTLASQVMLEYSVLALTAGGTLVASRDPDLATALNEHRATASIATVGKLNRLVRAGTPVPTLRALLVSGSPLPPHRLAEALDRLGPVVFHGYGQTETGLITMISPDELLADPALLTTVGRPPAQVELQVRDGELYVRSPWQASGYWLDPAMSAEVFTDGWVRTRDLAELAGDGTVRLLGRARDVIIVNATLVHAGPLERLLTADPSVAEAYVIGRPDDDTGESVHAFVVPAGTAAPDTELLRKAVRERFGDAAVPSTVTPIAQVPLAPSGKPDKKALG
jgi:fatty-acyl-CoA synthase